MHKISNQKLSSNKRASTNCSLGRGLFCQAIVIETEGKKSVVNALKFFEGCVKTEAAFFIRFEKLPIVYFRVLQRHFKTKESHIIFKNILKFWKVKN